MRQHHLAWLLLMWASLGAVAQTTGAALYETHCSACHQADGSGTVGLAPALKGDHWQKLGKDRSYVLTVITKGLSGRIDVNGQVFIGSMPSFAASLDDAALALIATHVRQLQDAAPAAPYSSQEVMTVRQSAGNPNQTRQLRQTLLSAN